MENAQTFMMASSAKLRRRPSKISRTAKTTNSTVSSEDTASAQHMVTMARRIFGILEETLVTDVDDVMSDLSLCKEGFLDELAVIFQQAIDETARKFALLTQTEDGRRAVVDREKSDNALGMLEKYLLGMVNTWRPRKELSETDVSILKSTVRNAVRCFANWYDAKVCFDRSALEQDEEEGHKFDLRVEEEPLPQTDTDGEEDHRRQKSNYQLNELPLRLEEERRKTSTIPPKFTPRKVTDLKKISNVGNVTSQMQSLAVGPLLIDGDKKHVPAQKSPALRIFDDSATDWRGKRGPAKSPCHEIKVDGISPFEPNGRSSPAATKSQDSFPKACNPVSKSSDQTFAASELRDSIGKLEQERLARSRALQRQSRKEVEILQKVNEADFPANVIKLKISESLELCRDILEEAHAKMEIVYVLAQLREEVSSRAVDRIAQEKDSIERQFAHLQRFMEKMQLSLNSIKENMPP